MIEFGNTLRAAREAKNMTTSEIAAQTHMLVQQIEALEREDFSRIAAPVYGRGFVRLYCETLGIDPRPLIEEFMEIYNGNRELNIRRKTGRRAALVVPPPHREDSEPPSDTSPADDEPPALEPSVGEPAPEPSVLPLPGADCTVDAAPEVPVRDDVDPFVLEQDPEPKPVRRFKRFNPYVQPEKPMAEEPRWRMPDIPPYVWRFALLAAAGLVLIWLLFAGVRAVYRASMSSPEDAGSEQTRQEAPGGQAPSAPTQQSPAQQPASQSKSGRTDRTPLEIPPLYID